MAGGAAWQRGDRGKGAGTGRRASIPAGAGERRGNRWAGMAFPEDLVTANQKVSGREITNCVFMGLEELLTCWPKA